MRDNFTNKTKELLAKRVAYRCSFPGCNRITIGPGSENNSAIINLGEAAHINAASSNGPRYDKNMTLDERRSISNGIWLCRHHARMIDADYINYSEFTIKQWKELAEKNTYELLKEFESEKIVLPTTLVAIGRDMVFEGVWKKIKKQKWTFEIIKFLIGDINKLLEFTTSKIIQNDKYIVIETQGDGRILAENPKLLRSDKNVEIEFCVEEKIKRTTPYKLTDIASPLKFEDGDLKLVKGEECAKQLIQNTLSIQHGDMFFEGNFGSYFSEYYWNFRENMTYLNRLIKLELTRLISIPYFDSVINPNSPPLDFINRIHEVEILDSEIIKNKIKTKIVLEWGDGKKWEDTVSIFVNEEKKNTAHNNT